METTAKQYVVLTVDVLMNRLKNLLSGKEEEPNDNKDNDEQTRSDQRTGEQDSKINNGSHAYYLMECGESCRFSICICCGLLLRQLFIADESSMEDDEDVVEKVNRLSSLVQKLGSNKKTPSDGEFAVEFLTSLNHWLGLNSQTLNASQQALGGLLGPAISPYVEGRCDLVVVDLLSLALITGNYDARARVLLQKLAVTLEIPVDRFENSERLVLSSLTAEYELSDVEKAQRDKERRNRKIKRGALIGVAAVGGGALIGLTGGLAAPFVATGMGALVGTVGGVTAGVGVASVLGSAAGVAIIGSLFGAAGAGLTGYKMNRRVGPVKEFGFVRLNLLDSRLNANKATLIQPQLRPVICVSGWLTKAQPDCTTAWLCVDESLEQYALQWESEALLNLGNGVDYFMNVAVTAAVQQALQQTVLATILSAIMWPATLVSASSVVDNPWGVCMNKADSAGEILANLLLAREHGCRPVTLIGFSMGARLIYRCLKQMAKRPNCEGIVQEVVLLGSPVPGDVASWRPLKRVVSGRIVNGYCSGDWLLKFLYRTSGLQLRIAGLAPIEWFDRRMENIDLSSLVTGHSDYVNKLSEILSLIGIRTRDVSGLAASRRYGSEADLSNVPRLPQDFNLLPSSISAP